MAGDCWKLRCDVEKLLNAEFQDMKSRLGCDEGDNVKASSAMLKIVTYLKAVIQEDIDNLYEIEMEDDG
ncbi:MAG: hypothetical protein RIR25_1929 [Verrucomicrobiota bacterium]|jgi:formylmethanofuran dehydrogenase subunit D